GRPVLRHRHHPGVVQRHRRRVRHPRPGRRVGSGRRHHHPRAGTRRPRVRGDLGRPPVPGRRRPRPQPRVFGVPEASGGAQRAHRRRTLRHAGEHEVVPLDRPGPRLVPRLVRARASGHRPQRTPVEPGPRPHPAPARTGEPHPPHLRVPALHPTLQVLRRRPHHRARPGRTHLLLQPRPVVQVPPPPQDPRRLDLPTHRSTHLPLDQPVGPRPPQRPHPPTTYL
ncbi:hypothetical protein PD653B2_2158, partial [Nocardioides sp. PD653-B2]